MGIEGILPLCLQVYSQGAPSPFCWGIIAYHCHHCPFVPVSSRLSNEEGALELVGDNASAISLVERIKPESNLDVEIDMCILLGTM